jgi:hypothetical protein
LKRFTVLLVLLTLVMTIAGPVVAQAHTSPVSDMEPICTSAGGLYIWKMYQWGYFTTPNTRQHIVTRIRTRAEYVYGSGSQGTWTFNKVWLLSGSSQVYYNQCSNTHTVYKGAVVEHNWYPNKYVTQGAAQLSGWFNTGGGYTASTFNSF